MHFTIEQDWKSHRQAHILRAGSTLPPFSAEGEEGAWRWAGLEVMSAELHGTEVIWFIFSRSKNFKPKIQWLILLQKRNYAVIPKKDRKSQS